LCASGIRSGDHIETHPRTDTKVLGDLVEVAGVIRYRLEIHSIE
jgi:hypothetical protein